MAQPVWRLVVDKRKVPENPTLQWTPVLEYAPPGKVLKIEVVMGGAWQPKGFSAGCSADGDYENTQPALGTPLLTSAPRGALIGRIGGSTADQTADTPTPPATPSRLIFSVGRLCVLTVPQAPTGALFLGVNDSPDRMSGLAGELYVNVYEVV
jgi:hypothetical protein